MLDDFETKQFIVYKQLKNILNSNVSHAYLFSSNNNIYSKQMILSFAKSIVCPYNYTNLEKCGDCSICKRIDNNNYPEIKVIKPDGLWIKKEELLELQREFSTKAIEGKKRVYIIYDAEKLNKQAANSLLKFLEEPGDNVVAILITENANLVLDTIVSRCQNIIFKNNKLDEYLKNYNIPDKNTMLKLFFIYYNGQDVETYLNDEKNMIFLDNIVGFVSKYEDSKIKMLNNTKKYFHDKFILKDDVYYAFELMILLYKDAIHYKISNKVKIFDNYIECIKNIADKNSKIKLVKKLNIIIDIKDLVKNNVNANLIIDKLIIDLEGGVSNV